MPASSLDTPIGRLLVGERDARIAAVRWSDAPGDPPTPLLARAIGQLRAYFSGDLKTFDLPLEPAPSAVAQAMRDVMTAIPFGGTATYGALAERAGSSARAMGGACASNPLPIVVPCHRVVAEDGSVHYSGRGGAATKHWLLAHEGATLI